MFYRHLDYSNAPIKKTLVVEFIIYLSWLNSKNQIQSIFCASVLALLLDDGITIPTEMVKQMLTLAKC